MVLEFHCLACERKPTGVVLQPHGEEEALMAENEPPAEAYG